MSWCWLWSLWRWAQVNKTCGELLSFFLFRHLTIIIRQLIWGLWDLPVHGRVGVVEALRHQLKYSISRCCIIFSLFSPSHCKSIGHVFGHTSSPVHRIYNFSSSSYHVLIESQAQTWQVKELRYLFNMQCCPKIDSSYQIHEPWILEEPGVFFPLVFMWQLTFFTWPST